MIPDLDIYRSAHLLVMHHGTDAPYTMVSRRPRRAIC